MKEANNITAKKIYGYGLVGFGLVLWHTNHCRLFNAKSIFIISVVLSQAIQFSISTLFKCQKVFYFKQFTFA